MLKVGNKRGFTLIELLVVIALIAVISGIGLTVYTQAQIVARDGRRKQDIKAMQTGLELYYEKYHRYPWYVTTSFSVVGDSAGCTNGGDTDWENLFTYGYDAAGAQIKIAGDKSAFMSEVPIDPLNNCVPAADAMHYNYNVDNTKGTGQDYRLYFSLENKNDPDISAACLLATNHDVCVNSPTP